MMALESAVVNRVIGDERRGGVMSDLVQALAFVAALALTVAAIYVAATS
jgi:hypothetical protein